MSTDLTNIGSMRDGEYELRGQPLSALIESNDPEATAWLAWTGMPPHPDQLAVIRACIIAATDHGAEPPCARTTRLVASCGKPLADCVAAGLLTLGPKHGNAGSEAARWLIESLQSGRKPEQAVDAARASNQRIPGFGHPIYEQDPRSAALKRVATAHALGGAHWSYALETEKVLSTRIGKPMPLNIDGAIGACIADMGARPELADALFILGRTAGLIAHALELSASTRYLR